MGQDEVIQALKKIGPCSAEDIKRYLRGGDHQRKYRAVNHVLLQLEKYGEVKSTPGRSPHGMPAKIWEVV